MIGFEGFNFDFLRFENGDFAGADRGWDYRYGCFVGLEGLRGGLWGRVGLEGGFFMEDNIWSMFSLKDSQRWEISCRTWEVVFSGVGWDGEVSSKRFRLQMSDLSSVGDQTPGEILESKFGVNVSRLGSCGCE